jgi:hypothetical protein
MIHLTGQSHVHLSGKRRKLYKIIREYMQKLMDLFVASQDHLAAN